MKTILFKIMKLPYVSQDIQEDLETIFFAASFGHEVAVLFMGDGVKQLIKDQTPPKGFKHHGKQLSALPSFDVSEFYAITEDIQQAHLDDQPLILPVKCIPAKALNDLFTSFDLVIG